ncbi:MAG TPA: protein kinase [Polyangiaceae bacterium]|nr:protein kinase [Polyangiaceae bacterium]
MSKYRLLARLGGGGMAHAYLGVAEGFEKPYVLKVLRSDVDEREKAELIAMFQDEGKLAARLNHPNIVQSHDMGCDRGEHFIAMEYLAGQPLSLLQERWTEDPECFPLELRLFVIAQLLDGLDYAHNLADYDGKHLRIVHRDVSQQNVFVTYDGHTKLLDFGIAKTQRSRKTRAGIVKGKVPYMAPEQVKGGELDARADLFSVGVVLWECIANRHFHTDENEYEILKRVAEGRFPRLRDCVSNVPSQLDKIVSRALAMDPNDRYPDARAFREDLLSFGRVREVSTQDVGRRMQALFARERKVIAEIISVAISRGPDGNADPTTQTALALPFLPTAHTEPKTRDPISTTSPTTAVVDESRISGEARASSLPVASPPAQRSSLPRLLVVGSAGAAMTAAVLAIALGERPVRPAVNANLPASAPKPEALPASKPVAPQSPAPKPAPVDVPAVPAPVASAEQAQLLQLSIVVKPATASVWLDGERIQQIPIHESRVRDGAVHKLRVTAPGYVERNLSLSFTKDIAETVELVRAASPPPPPPPVPRPEPTWVNPNFGGPTTKGFPRPKDLH